MPDNAHPRGENRRDDLWLLDRLADETHTLSPALAGLLSCVTSPASHQELAGEAAALAAFAEVRSGVATARIRTRVRRIPVFATMFAGKLAAAAAAGGIALAGTAAAAYTDSLPAPMQELAHHSLGAPPPTSTLGRAGGPPTSAPTGRRSPAVVADGNANGPAAHGLCVAHEHGGLAGNSAAYRSLAKAAGGASRIDAYCASVARAGRASTGHPAEASISHHTGAPSARQSRVVPTHGTSAPTHPTEARTSHPSPSTERK